MQISKEINGLKITRQYFSPTLKQTFKDGKFKATAPTAVHCVPMDWGFIVKGFVEFFVDDKYYVNYEDFSNEKVEVEKLIKFSKSEFLKMFKNTSPTPINVDFESFHGEAKDILLRDQILAQIHSRD